MRVRAAQADGLWCCTGRVQRGDEERRRGVRHHDILRDVPGPRDKSLNVGRGNGVLVRGPKVARLLFVCVFCQLKDDRQVRTDTNSTRGTHQVRRIRIPNPDYNSSVWEVRDTSR